MIKVENVSHRYANREDSALREVNLHVKKGERVVIIGASGCGKSTLMKCINRLVEPSTGRVHIDGQEITRCPNRQTEAIRGTIGMIFQNFNIFERETVLSNVLNGRLRFNQSLRSVVGKFSKEDYAVARENIHRVGLGSHMDETTANLSGGQKQRVAIARALSQNPNIILADEPVSNLDPKLMREIMDLLDNICSERGITLVSSLHFLEFAKRYGTRIIGMREGKIVFDGKPGDLTDKDVVDIYGKTRDWYMYGKAGY